MALYLTRYMLSQTFVRFDRPFWTRSRSRHLQPAHGHYPHRPATRGRNLFDTGRTSRGDLPDLLVECGLASVRCCLTDVDHRVKRSLDALARSTTRSLDIASHTSWRPGDDLVGGRPYLPRLLQGGLPPGTIATPTACTLTSIMTICPR